MTARFAGSTLAELTEEYAKAHRLSPERRGDIASYMRQAVQRERWGVRYLEFCLHRYAADGRPLDAALALEAGCGSGGALPHLLGRFEHVVGVDTDLPALIIAAKRCADLGVADRVTLVAAPLEQKVFPECTFSLVKCTDVVEHVASPTEACRRLIAALKPGGAAFILTPNRWTLTPEPHVRLWGVQFMPSAMADRYVRWRIGVPYSSIARLLSYRELMRIVSEPGSVEVTFIPAEDKYLNPDSKRGRAIKRLFQSFPLRTVSRLVRPVQPVLTILCLRRRVSESGAAPSSRT